MYVAALDHVSLMKVKDQCQVHLLIIHPNKLYFNLLHSTSTNCMASFKENRTLRGGWIPSFHTPLLSYQSQSFSFHVKSQLLKLSYLLLRGKWKIKMWALLNLQTYIPQRHATVLSFAIQTLPVSHTKHRSAQLKALNGNLERIYSLNKLHQQSLLWSNN